MTTDHALYNIKRGPHGYAIGKFDRDLNLLAAYNVDTKYCSCPAGPRPTCRHRKMLPRMLAKVDQPEFYCYETNTWQSLFELSSEARSPQEPEPELATAGGNKVVQEQLEMEDITQAASEMLNSPPSPEAAVMYANTELAMPVALAPSPTIRRR